VHDTIKLFFDTLFTMLLSRALQLQLLPTAPAPAPAPIHITNLLGKLHRYLLALWNLWAIGLYFFINPSSRTRALSGPSNCRGWGLELRIKMSKRPAAPTDLLAIPIALVLFF
jgi:hypothetical protein